MTYFLIATLIGIALAQLVWAVTEVCWCLTVQAQQQESPQLKQNQEVSP